MLKERMHEFSMRYNKHVCTYQSSPHEKVNVIVFQNIGGHFANLKRDIKRSRNGKGHRIDLAFEISSLLVVPARGQNGGRR